MKRLLLTISILLTFGVGLLAQRVRLNGVTAFSQGTFTGVTFNQTITIPLANAFSWVGSTILTAATNGQLNITNAAASAGVGFDVTTDSTLKVRTRAQSGYGTVDALAYNSSGTALTTGTTLLTSGTGMAVANVGANSCGTTAATIAGNNNAFVVTVGATSGTQCRVAFTVTATAEWDCASNDDTTTVAVRTTPIDTTHTDLIGAFVAGDKVTGICFPR